MTEEEFLAEVARLLAEGSSLETKIQAASASTAWYQGYAAGTRDTTALFKAPPWKTPPTTPNPYAGETYGQHAEND